MNAAHLLIALVLALPSSWPDVPSITSLNRSWTIAGASRERLTVTGANFSRQSVVRWSGFERPTTFVSATELQVEIPGSDLATAGTAQLTVFNSGGNGGTSNAVTFTIGNPVPVVQSVTPGLLVAGGEPLNLVVRGSSFVPGTMVQWNGVGRQTTYQGPTQLAVSVLASDLAGAGAVQVTALNPAPIGGSSASVSLMISVTAPVISSISPATQTIGGGQSFTVRVTGQGFIRSAQLLVDGQRRATSFVTSTQLDATLLASDADTAGTAALTVQQSLASGDSRVSAPASFSTTYPVPGISRVSPQALNQGGSGNGTVVIEGAGFVAGHSVVKLNGRRLNMQATSATRIQGVTGASSLDAVGTGVVTVENPAPGGGTASFNVTIKYPVPHLEALQPVSAVAGGPAFTLTVRGQRFRPTTVVQWRSAGGVTNVGLSTTFISPQELRALVPAANMLSKGPVVVSVFDSTSAHSNIHSFDLIGLVTAIPVPIAGSPPAQPARTLPGTSSIPSNPVTGTALPPALASIAPQNVFRGGPAFTLTVRGERFTPGTKVYWKGAERPTTYVSATELRATIAAADITAVGSAEIRVGLTASALTGSARLGVLDAMVRR